MIGYVSYPYVLISLSNDLLSPNPSPPEEERGACKGRAKRFRLRPAPVAVIRLDAIEGAEFSWQARKAGVETKQLFECGRCVHQITARRQETP